MLFAGHETTVSTMLVRLLGDRERWAALAEGSADVGPLLEELLRVDASDPLTWGHGAHHCIGAALARLQLRTAITATPRRYPTLHLARDVVEIPNHLLRISAVIPSAADYSL